MRFAVRLSGAIAILAATATAVAQVVLDAVGLLPYPLGPALRIGTGISLVVAGAVGFFITLAIGRAIGALAIHRDEFRRLSNTDDLSGLLSRRAFLAAMDQRPADALILFDIDHFKAINDRHGHQVGDEVIRTLGGLFRGAPATAARQIGRLGGEEFGILLPSTPLGAARHVAESLREQVARAAIVTRVGTLSVTLSGGVAVPLPGESPAGLFGRCDEALYGAKRSGRNRVIAALASASASAPASDAPLQACG